MKYLIVLAFASILTACSLSPEQKMQLRAEGKSIVKIINGAVIRLTKQELAALAAQGLK